MELLLGITGIFATLILGYLGVKYSLKSKRKTDIIFILKGSISLFNTIVKNLDDLEIKFHGKKIDENLILFKGSFFNNGNVDIDKSIVHKPIELELPSNYNLVKHKIIDVSEGLHIKSKEKQNKLIFEWDLFKEAEYFTFYCLIEYKSSKNANDQIDISNELVKNIKINHRISDLKNVNKEYSLPKPMPIKGLIILSIFLISMSIVLFIGSFGKLFNPSFKVRTQIRTQSGVQYVEFGAKKENEITITDSTNNIIKIIKKDEVINPTGYLITEKVKINYFEMIFGGLFSILILIGLISMFVTELRDRRLYNKLKKLESKDDDPVF